MKNKLRLHLSNSVRVRRTIQLIVAGTTLSILITVIAFIFLNIGNNKNSSAAAPAANLNQGKNGTDSAPTSPLQWVNGNLSASQAHYIEGMSTPYQCVMTDLPIGGQVTIIIGYDIKSSSKNAFDYLTHYNRLLPHNFPGHSTPETIDPLAGTGLSAGTLFSTYAIPMPSATGTPVAGQPTNNFNALASAEKLMTLYNGTIDTIYYSTQGSLTASSSETRVAVTLTPSATTAVLVWGGHIASRNDWGITSGSPNSAGGISGSPFHMRLISWSYGALGSQDRSLAGGSVSAPASSLPVTLVSFCAAPVEQGIKISWATASEFNNDYFMLEHSADGLQYFILDNIDGAGNSNDIKNYSYFDENPQPGTNYYRLTQIDFDGTQKTFNSVSIKKNDDPFSLSVVNLYPNPSTGNFSITYKSEENALTQLDIRNAEGKLIHSEPLKSKEGVNQYNFDTKTNLPKGIYFVSLSQGKYKTEAKRIVKY